MALSAIIVTYTANTGTGDQTLTGAGFTPKCAIVYYSRATNTVDTFSEHVSFGFGFTDGTNSRCAYEGSEDNQTSSDTVHVVRDNALIVTYNLTGTITTQDGAATFSSFNSDGMVINWSDAPAAAFKFHVLYLGGADLTDVNVGTFTQDQAGDQDITTVGFQPDGLMFIGWVSTMNSVVTVTTLGIGAADASANQWGQTINSEQNRTTMDTWQGYSHSQAMAVLISATGSWTSSFSHVSMLSNGFRINGNGSTSFNNYGYLALKGCSVAVGNNTEPGSTGNQTVTTSKDCKAVIVCGLDTGTAGSGQADAMQTVGAGTSSSNMATVVIHDLDAALDSTCVSRYETDSIYLNITANATAGSSTVDDEASLSSVSSTGFVLNWSNIGNARPFRYITFGDAAAAAAVTEEERRRGFGSSLEMFEQGIGDARSSVIFG